MNNYIQKSILRKFLTIVLMMVLTLVLLIALFQVTSQKAFFDEELTLRIALMKKGMERRGKTLSDNIALFTENAISAYDFYGISQMLEKFVDEEKDLEYGILMDSAGMAHIHTLRQDLLNTTLRFPEDTLALNQKSFATNEFKKNGMTFLEFIRPIHISDRYWGVLRLGFSVTALQNEIQYSKTRMNEKVNALLYKSAFITVVTLVIGCIFVIFMTKHIIKPLNQLTDFADKFGKENFDVTIPVEATASRDEIGFLSRAFENMASNLKRSYEQLGEHSKMLEENVQERTKELKNAFDDLKTSQEQLIKTEKMASLAELVAGVAHEINTPIGVSVTASSFLEEQISKLKKILDSDEVDESEINPVIKNISNSAEMILSNLSRASKLVVSFKQTSADQTSQERRQFSIKKVIADTLNTLEPRLKKTSITITNACPRGLVIDSFPGAISQIITNLVINSIIHAFRENETGHIDIGVTENRENSIKIIYHDNGNGIPEDMIKKIFDPFFTTSRNRGGTGLGLHIVFNIVHQALQGEISCESVPGQGTFFYIEIPKIAEGWKYG